MKRRRFLKAGLAGSLCAAMPTWRSFATGEPLTLTAGTRVIEVNGRAATVYGLSGPGGRPGLVLDQEKGFHVRLVNGLTEKTLIHWHGLTPPNALDGVPDRPAPMLEPGESRVYDFPLALFGTNWMHAHTLQEQNLLAAPLIVRSREDRARDEQEVVLFLHDFSFTRAEDLLAGLKSGSSGHGMDHAQMDHSHMDHGGMTMQGMGDMDMGKMDMSGMAMGGMDMPGMAMDLNDIDYDAYLANDRTLDDPEVVRVEKGGRVRLRVINAAASTGFTLDLGVLEGSLLAVDGQPVRPQPVKTVPLTMAQRLDILIDIPREGGAFPVLALREGAPERTGLILATAGTGIAKLSSTADRSGPVLDLAFEGRLEALRPLAARPADRTTGIGLAGNMAGYDWRMTGTEALTARKGERLEITLSNGSMMAHPMHLHGHHFQVVAINGRRISGAVRDTVLVPPMQAVTIAFNADNPGTWAFHCHHLYHMMSGMMAFLPYEET